MTTHVKVGSSWKDVEEIHVKVGTVWKPVENAYAKVGTTWKETYSADPDWANMAIGTKTHGGMFAGIYSTYAMIIAINLTADDASLDWQDAIDYWEGATINGFNDWVLPTFAHILIIMSNIVALDDAGVGCNLSTSYNKYWTSTSSDTYRAYCVVFNGSQNYTNLKVSSLRSRGIRLIDI